MIEIVNDGWLINSILNVEHNEKKNQTKHIVNCFSLEFFDIH